MDLLRSKLRIAQSVNVQMNNWDYTCPCTTKYPMLLPRKGKLVELIVKDCHYRVNHGEKGRKLLNS